jgi:phenylalanyl-tRNA synthetase alpha chain
VRVTALGKKGKITDLLKGLGSLDADTRKTQGAALNVLRDEISAMITSREHELKHAGTAARLASETVDITLPARDTPRGKIHPISQTMEDITTIFAQMGSRWQGPDVEDDFHNFDKFPRSPTGMHDTFICPMTVRARRAPENYCARMPPVQIRHMMNNKPPIHICYGRTYCSDYDLTTHQCFINRRFGYRQGRSYGAFKRLFNRFLPQHRRFADALPVVFPLPNHRPRMSAVHGKVAH